MNQKTSSFKKAGMGFASVRLFPLSALFIYFIFAIVPGFTRAGSTQSPASGVPIVTRMDLGLFGLIGGSMEYSWNGKKITRDEDFQKLIYPLRDEEASRLIHEARDQHFVAAMFYVGGAAIGVDFALAFKPTPVLGIDWMDRIATGLFAGQIFVAIGALFDGNADARKFNAVQRYNKLVENQEDAFFGFSTQVSLRKNGFGMSLARSF